MLGRRLLAFAIFLPTGMLAAESSEFQPHVDYATGSIPVSVAIADFNQDGKLDLAVANSSSNTVSILLGNGNGTFQNQVDYATGSSPNSVAVGDFNGDGRPDLVTANYGNLGDGHTVSVLLGKGDGTFQPQVQYLTGSGPIAVVVSDFNRDGIPDLAVANHGGPGHLGKTVTVLLGTGNGRFGAPVEYATGNLPYSVAVADFNGDGIPDLAVADYNSNAVSVLLGNGDGTFQAQAEYATGAGPDSVAAGDLNGDGNIDLVTANTGIGTGNSISVLLGNGDGTFQGYVDYATGTWPTSVAIGDFNGDGIADLVTPNFFGGNTVSVLLGNGDGTFEPQVEYGTGEGPTSVAVGDFNRDGAQDLAVTDNGAATASVLLNSGGTQIALTSSMNPSMLGQPVTFRTSVTPTFSGVGTPSGRVTFRDGEKTLGTAPLVSGRATFTASGLSAGTHRITSEYSGDSTFNPHTSRGLAQQVRP